jgi:lysophospholipase L1-like esterase
MPRILALIAFALISAHAFAQSRPATTKPHNFDRWEPAIQKFEAADKQNPPAEGGIVFIGSSTIGGWKTLQSDYPKQVVLNRGFGGSEIIDATHFADRIIIPYAPKKVFLRSGSNDIHAGKSPELLLEHFKQFVEVIHAKLPETKIYFIGLNPAPVRGSEAEANRKLNDLVAEFVKNQSNVVYVDAYDISLDASGKIREELFRPDRLHFNADGYKLLIERVRPFIEKD